jgi:hypothetical protein
MRKVFWLLISLLFLVVYFAKQPVRAQDTLPPFVILGQCQKGFSACFGDCRRSYSESTINWERNRIRCGNICINKRAKCDYQAWRKLGAVIRIELLEGTAVPMAKLLASSVAENLEKRNIPATAENEKRSRYVLKGRAEYDPKAKKKPFVALIHWTLVGDDNEPVGTYVQGVKGTPVQWEFGDPRIIRRIGNNAAKPIAAMIRNDTDATQPSRRRGGALLVRVVKGAPGDGNQTLTEAMKISMRDADFNVTDDKPPVNMPIEPPQPRVVIAKPQPKRVQPQLLTPVAKPAPKIRSQSPKNTTEKKPVIAVMSNETRRISELDKKSADTQIADASTSQNKHFVSLAEQWDGKLVNSLCTSKSTIKKAYCAISIGASIGMLTTLKLIEKDGNLEKVVCIPPDLVPFEQTNDIVAKYIKDNIKKRNMSLSVLVVLALRKAYPCKK